MNKVHTGELMDNDDTNGVDFSEHSVTAKDQQPMSLKMSQIELSKIHSYIESNIRYKKSHESNRLCVYPLLNQNKLFALIATSVQHLPELKVYWFSASWLISFLHLSSPKDQFGNLGKLCRSLVSKSTENSSGVLTESYFHQIYTAKDNNEKLKKDLRGLIGFKLSTEGRAEILRILSSGQDYLSYYLFNINKFNFKHSLRIYEIIKQYQRHDLESGWYQTTFTNLMSLMNLSNYKSYDLTITNKAIGNFNRDILRKASEEIKEHSDIRFEVEKKIINGEPGLKFKIFPNKTNVHKSVKNSYRNIQKGLIDKQARVDALAVFPSLTEQSKKSIANVECSEKVFNDNVELLNKSELKNNDNIGGTLTNLLRKEAVKKPKPKPKKKESPVEPINHQDSEEVKVIEHLKAKYSEYKVENIVINMIDNPEQGLKSFRSDSPFSGSFPREIEDIYEAVEWYKENSSTALAKIVTGSYPKKYNIEFKEFCFYCDSEHGINIIDLGNGSYKLS